MNEVWAALAGAIVGSLATYLGAIRLHQLETKDTRKRFANALLAEAQAGRERYWETFGKHIQALKPGEAWMSVGQIVTTQNFLAVYDSTADKLGLLEPKDIDLVVRAATLTKGHIETINVAYREVSVWTDLMHQSARAGDTQAAQRMENLRDQLRVAAGKGLREESIQLVDAMDKAIAALEKYTH